MGFIEGEVHISEAIKSIMNKQIALVIDINLCYMLHSNEKAGSPCLLYKDQTYVSFDCI